MLEADLKIIQLSAGQGKNRRDSAVYMGVNEHFEPIFLRRDVPAEGL